jgi:fatty-acyl-CoA synthase/benzoate-CoA ligase/fatty acid CoA ligase FadD22
VDALASAYAARLAELGVTRRDRVLIVLPDGVDFVGALFGIFRLGAVVVMLNPSLTTEAIAAIVERSRAAAAVVHQDHLDAFEIAVSGWRPEVLVVDGAALPGADVETAPTSPGDPAIWLFSGGTTGEPKAVEQTHRSLVNTTRLYGQGTLGLTEEDVTISVPKLFFGYATGGALREDLAPPGDGPGQRALGDQPDGVPPGGALA